MIILFIIFILISISIIHNFKILEKLRRPYHYAENKANELRYINYYFLIKSFVNPATLVVGYKNTEIKCS